MMIDYEFRTCPRCAGYGVRDSGQNCTMCGGYGRGGLNSHLFSWSNQIGSGEIIIDRATGKRITHAEYLRRVSEGEPHG